MSRLSRSRATRAAIAAALVLAGSSLAAQEARRADAVEFNIQPQTLTAALSAWSVQAGLQIVWPAGSNTRNSNSTQLYGKFDPMQALQLLLQGSGLTYSLINERTVVIQERVKAAPPTMRATKFSADGARPAPGFVRLKAEQPIEPSRFAKDDPELSA
jgi:hypothetical protein